MRDEDKTKEQLIQELQELRRRISDLESPPEHLKKLSEIIEFLPDAMIVVDPHRTVVAWNRAMEEMTGLGKEEILGRDTDMIAMAAYGRPGPLLVDLVLQSDLDAQSFYEHVNRRGVTLYTEAFVPGSATCRSGHVSAIASPIHDREGNVIGAIESIRDITEHKKMEEALRQRESELEEQSRDLEEINTALRVLLKNREEDQKEFEMNFLTNLKELVFPYLRKLRGTRLNDMQRTCLSLVESHLNGIGAPFARRLSLTFVNLSPMERQIAGFIKEGMQNKEISEILGVSPNTVSTHRYHLRTKLGLKKNKVNLASYLQSLDED